MPQTRPFHNKIQDVKARVGHMASLARKSLLDGTTSLENLDQALANEVIARDKELNRIDVEIEREILDLIALHQPMGGDIRTLGACIKMITYIDRIGRYGYDIAKVTKEFEGKQHIRKLVVIPTMAELVAQMLDDAMEAFQKGDLEKARSVFQKDERVDVFYDQVFRQCVTHMLEDPATISQCAHYILVARHLERAGDNACKVAEKTVYMISGKRRLDV